MLTLPCPAYSRVIRVEWVGQELHTPHELVPMIVPSNFGAPRSGTPLGAGG
jgi:hypothetical protein